MGSRSSRSCQLRYPATECPRKMERGFGPRTRTGLSTPETGPMASICPLSPTPVLFLSWKGTARHDQARRRKMSIASLPGLGLSGVAVLEYDMAYDVIYDTLCSGCHRALGMINDNGTESQLPHWSKHACIYIHIYIYTYIERQTTVRSPFKAVRHDPQYPCGLTAKSQVWISTLSKAADLFRVPYEIWSPKDPPVSCTSRRNSL